MHASFILDSNELDYSFIDKLKVMFQNKRIELVHVDKKILLKKLVNKEMIIVDESAPNEIRVYKNMNDVVIDKTNERAIFYKLKTNDTCIIEVVGAQTFWFHTIPNITRVFECRKDK